MDSAQVLIDKLSAFVLGEVGAIIEVDEELNKLRRTLRKMKAMLSDVEENSLVFSNTNNIRYWKVWMEDVETVVYSTEDFLDGVLLSLSKDIADESAIREQLIRSLKVHTAGEIKNHRVELDEFAKQMESFYYRELKDMGRSMGRRIRHATTSSLVDERSIIGREGDKNAIVKMLLNVGSNSNFCVVPIVGMGGMGKTALARIVYDDHELDAYYDMKMWISVSIEFDIIRMTKAIIEFASKKRCKLSELDLLQAKLQNLIRDKKFLLVLDDYWSNKYTDWESLFAPLRVGKNGSGILLTTRSVRVSQIVGTVPPYHLGELSNDDIWRLIKERAMLDIDLTCKFEEIGTKIAEKCKGLPSVAKIVGNILRFKDDQREWKAILNTEWWEFDFEEHDIFSSLALSYYDLPTHLKKCFSYCAMFPKAYLFRKDDLVSMWMAEGFIRPVANVRMEDLAKDYIRDLHHRSLFQCEETDTNTNYILHDLIYGLARVVSGNSCLHVEDYKWNEDYKFSINTRHISFHWKSQLEKSVRGLHYCKNLRTVKVIRGSMGKVNLTEELFEALKVVRVLHLSDIDLVVLPDNIGKVKRLRYLDLSTNSLKKLPDSLTHLSGLKTLKLDMCPFLDCLPVDTRKLLNLEELYLDKNFPQMPPKLGKLVKLRRLSLYVVGTSMDDGIGELRDMNRLSGCLHIKQLENIRNLNDAEGARLDMKPFLDRLEFEWVSSESTNDKVILDGLEPHTNLKELSLTNYKSRLLSDWFTGLCNLVSIELCGCKYYDILAIIARLQNLERLTIVHMADWVTVEDDFSGFRSLRTLMLKHIPNLSSWGSFYGSRFPRLLEFFIEDCPALINLPSLVDTNSLRCLEISQCRNISSLPDDGFPGSLKNLKIIECPILVEKCKNNDCAESRKIGSITSVTLRP